MIQTLSNALKTKFETLVWTNKPLVSVKDYHTLENSWFPYLTFECIWFEASILDTCNNNRTFQFDVYIFQDVIDNDRKTSKENLNKIIDEILLLIDSDYTLWLSNVKQIQPVTWTIQAFDMQNGKALIWALRLNIETYLFIK